MFVALKRLWEGEEGQGLTENGLLLNLASLLVIAGMQVFGDGVSGLFSNLGS